MYFPIFDVHIVNSSFRALVPIFHFLPFCNVTMNLPLVHFAQADLPIHWVGAVVVIVDGVHRVVGFGGIHTSFRFSTSMSSIFRPRCSWPILQFFELTLLCFFNICKINFHVLSESII